MTLNDLLNGLDIPASSTVALDADIASKSITDIVNTAKNVEGLRTIEQYLSFHLIDSPENFVDPSVKEKLEILLTEIQSRI